MAVALRSAGYPNMIARIVVALREKLKKTPLEMQENIPSPDEVAAVTQNCAGFGSLLMGFEMREVFNRANWCGPQARSNIREGLALMAQACADADPEAIAAVRPREKHALNVGIAAGIKTFGGSVMLAADHYRFNDGSELVFEGDLWVARNEKTA